MDPSDVDSSASDAPVAGASDMAERRASLLEAMNVAADALIRTAPPDHDDLLTSFTGTQKMAPKVMAGKFAKSSKAMKALKAKVKRMEATVDELRNENQRLSANIEIHVVPYESSMHDRLTECGERPSIGSQVMVFKCLCGSVLDVVNWNSVERCARNTSCTACGAEINIDWDKPRLYLSL